MGDSDLSKTGAVKPARGRECPICGKPASAEHEPFCSRRCALVDLNRWLSGAYAIPGGSRPEDDPENGG